MKPIQQGPVQGGGASAPAVGTTPSTPAPGSTVAGAAGGGAGQAAAGANALGGGALPGDMASILKALVDALNALVKLLGQPPVSGGGGLPPVKQHIDHVGGAGGIRKP